jgi:hypothetical protein
MEARAGADGVGGCWTNLFGWLSGRRRHCRRRRFVVTISLDQVVRQRTSHLVQHLRSSVEALADALLELPQPISRQRIVAGVGSGAGGTKRPSGSIGGLVGQSVEPRETSHGAS